MSTILNVIYNLWSIDTILNDIDSAIITLIIAMIMIMTDNDNGKNNIIFINVSFSLA